MPIPLRLSRRFPAAMSEAGYRRLRTFAQDTGLSEGEALSFVFENLDGLVKDDALPHRLRLFRARLEDKTGK
jgi:hypothetical protein